MKSMTQRLLVFASIALTAFTGCGEQKPSSAPEPPSTATANASSNTSTSATAQATRGEYRPADEHGPAQNVPKPVEPEGMNVETAEGMELFINYWNDLRNYAMQTGDTTEIKKLVDESYLQELEFYESLEEIYSSGGWVIGGERKIHYTKESLNLDDQIYSLDCNFEIDNLVLWSGGKAHAFDNSDYIYKNIKLKFKFDSDSWSIISADIIN